MGCGENSSILLPPDQVTRSLKDELDDDDDDGSISMRLKFNISLVCGHDGSISMRLKSNIS